MSIDKLTVTNRRLCYSQKGGEKVPRLLCTTDTLISQFPITFNRGNLDLNYPGAQIKGVIVKLMIFHPGIDVTGEETARVFSKGETTCDDAHITQIITFSIDCESMGVNITSGVVRKEIFVCFRELKVSNIHRHVPGPRRYQLGGSGDSPGFFILCVYDKWSRKWLGLWLIPSHRLEEAAKYLYAQLVAKLNGSLLQLTTDQGSEHAFALIGESFTPEFVVMPLCSMS